MSSPELTDEEVEEDEALGHGRGAGGGRVSFGERVELLRGTFSLDTVNLCSLSTTSARRRTA